MSQEPVKLTPEQEINELKSLQTKFTPLTTEQKKLQMEHMHERNPRQRTGNPPLQS